MHAVLLGLLTLTAWHDLAAQAAGVERFLRSEMQERRIPGLQVAVVRHGKVVFHGGYGVASVQYALPVTDQTVFSINSGTKAFTGVAVMQLVEAGKVDLAAPVARYLSGLPAEWQAVTIRQLLNHTSGIPDILDPNTGNVLADAADDPLWAKIQGRPTEFVPGARFSYNQTNYLLLGKVIDTLSGRPFVDFITERQFRIAGMRQAGFGDSRDVIRNKAQSYRFVRDAAHPAAGATLTNVIEEFPAFIRTGAGINTTATEVAQWIVALQQGRFFTAKTSLPTLWEPGVRSDGTPETWALGWPAISRPKHRAVAGIGGGRSAFYVYPDDDLAVVILTNLSGASPEELIDRVAGYFIPALRESRWDAMAAVRTKLERGGFDQALPVVAEATRRDPGFELPREDVNDWGYRLLSKGRLRDAVEIFRLNVSLYPANADVYDSLAEGFEAVGDRKQAVANYLRSLKLDPKNAHAEQRLKAIEAMGGRPTP